MTIMLQTIGGWCCAAVCSLPIPDSPAASCQAPYKQAGQARLGPGGSEAVVGDPMPCHAALAPKRANDDGEPHQILKVEEDGDADATCERSRAARRWRVRGGLLESLDLPSSETP